MKILRNLAVLSILAFGLANGRAMAAVSTCSSSDGGSASCSGATCTCSGCGFLWIHTCCSCS